MSHDSQDKKISQFTQQLTFQATDILNIVRSNTNFKIPVSGLPAFLGVTGTIVPRGTGTPVLNQPTSTSNEIRGIEAGVGIIVGLGVSDDVQIKHNFDNIGSGTSLIKSLITAKTEWKSLIAGPGIAIASTGDQIQISTAVSPVTTKTVIIAEASDFPTAIGGVINLVAGTDYLLVQDISTPNRFVVANNSVIRAANSAIIKFTYTGTETFLTGVDANFKIEKIKPNCPTGKLFDMSETVPGGVFQMNDMTVESCDEMGTLNDLSAVQITNIAFDDVKTDGMKFLGNIPVFILERCVFTQLLGNVLDLGTATFDGITLITNFATVSAGVSFLKGATGSANINTGGLGTVFNSRISGAGASLSGISSDDALWNFFGNDDIPDTRPDGLLSFQTPTTTVLSAATPALITGTWVVERNSQMTGSVAGRLTYNGGKDAILPISATVSIEPVSGTNKVINLYAAKNGSIIANSKVTTVVSAGSPKNQTVNWQDNFSTTDFYECFIESVDGTDLQTNTATLRVN